MEFRNLVRQFLDNVFVKTCASFKTNPKKCIAQEIFWILNIKVFRNDYFHAGQEVKKNYVVRTLTSFQYNKYIDVIHMCKNKINVVFIIKKKKKLKNILLTF